MESMQDAKSIKIVRQHISNIAREPRTEPSKYFSSLYYDMSKRGLAVILNHYEYKDDQVVYVPRREGTEFDTERLRRCLKRLNFKVKIFNDSTIKEIDAIMSEVAELSSEEISCLIVVVMTHGEQGILRASDSEYEIQMLWDGLTSKNCPKLIGVPKLFFIQACRGDKMDPGYTYTDSIAVRQQAFKIPSMADFLHMYSTYEDHTSWREADGSWFIQSLCEIFEEESPNFELLQLLTFVNNKVALEYQSYTRTEESDQMKQIPQIVSMLTKLLKFNVQV